MPIAHAYIYRRAKALRQEFALLQGQLGQGEAPDPGIAMPHLFHDGRRQRAVVPLVCGLALMIFPYFVANVPLLVGIGVVLITIPYFLRR